MDIKWRTTEKHRPEKLAFLLVVLVISWCWGLLLVSFWCNSWPVGYQRKDKCRNYFITFLMLSLATSFNNASCFQFFDNRQHVQERDGHEQHCNGLHTDKLSSMIHHNTPFNQFSRKQTDCTGIVETISGIRTVPTQKVAHLTTYLSVWSYYAQTQHFLPSAVIRSSKLWQDWELRTDTTWMSITRPWQNLTAASTKLYSSCKIISHAMKTPDGGH